jgi:predicted PurR-regulated permease PerM
MYRFLQGFAYVVIIMWGIRAASQLLVPVLLALLLAYGFVSWPEWLMRRFHLGKTAALVWTVALLGSFNLFSLFLLYERALRMMKILPVYQQRFMDLYGKIVVFLSAHGIALASLPTAKLSTSEKIVQLTRFLAPEAGDVFSGGLLISVLAWIFLVEMVDEDVAKRGSLAQKLAYYGGDVRRYIAISAKTGVITALANLVLLVALGVDFPVIWCFLYFFLHFIPNVGFIFALVPPAFLALLMAGWERALMVVGGMVLTQILTDYVLTPLFMKKEVHVSFLQITLSLMLWGFLLGPAGTIVAVPLTMAVRRFSEELSIEEKLAGDAVGMASAASG